MTSMPFQTSLSEQMMLASENIVRWPFGLEMHLHSSSDMATMAPKKVNMSEPNPLKSLPGSIRKYTRLVTLVTKTATR